MKQKLKGLAAISAILIFIILGTTTAFALSINARGGFLINVNTGEALFEKNPDSRYSLASMSKLMAVYVIMDKIKAGDLSFDTKILISRNVHNYSRISTISNIPLNSGAYYTVDELMDSILVASACGSVVAIAEHISGSEAAFVELMNAKVDSLSINASFSNSTGTVGSNVISPRGMAVLAANLVTNHPEILAKTSKKQITFRGGRYNSTNKLLGSYVGVDGLKTGTSSTAGACFTATAERDGIRLVSVVFSSSDRFNDARRLLDFGFANPGEDDAGLQGEGYGTEVYKPAHIPMPDLHKEDIGVIYNDIRIPFYDIDPIKIDGCVFVPLRVMASTMGADILWANDEGAELTKADARVLTVNDEESKLEKGKVNISIKAGSTTMVKNGEEIPIRDAPFVKDGYLMVPVRVLTDAFLSRVSWEAENNFVVIND